MKRTIIILTITLVAFGLGYWTGTIKNMVDEKFDIVTEAIEASKQTAKEKFDDFVYKFIADSSFQLERIKFPLKSSIQPDLDEVDTKALAKKDWKIVRLFGQQEYRPQIYDNFKRELRDTDERLFCWEGIENGIYVEYKFQRLSGLWYLTEYNDFSD
jgi:hypothetical protein